MNNRHCVLSVQKQLLFESDVNVNEQVSYRESSPLFIPSDDDVDHKQKSVLSAQYKGFQIYGKSLCLILQPLETAANIAELAQQETLLENWMRTTQQSVFDYSYSWTRITSSKLSKALLGSVTWISLPLKRTGDMFGGMIMVLLARFRPRQKLPCTSERCSRRCDTRFRQDTCLVHHWLATGFGSMQSVILVQSWGDSRVSWLLLSLLLPYLAAQSTNFPVLSLSVSPLHHKYGQYQSILLREISFICTHLDVRVEH